MSLCGLTCRIRCRVVSLCYDTSAASDAQCPTLCFIPWSCRWICHVSITAMQHSPACVTASSTSVGAQCRRQTDTLIFSVWARHTDVVGPALAAVSRMHRLQADCARLSMTAWSGAMVSLQSHPVRHRFQPPPSPVVIFVAASDWTHMAVYCWRSCISGGCKPPLQ